MIITKGIRLGLVSRISGRVNDVEQMLSLLDTNNVKLEDNVDMTQSHKRIKYANDVYYVFENTNWTTIYKLLPNVVDDEMFHWKERVLVNRVRNQWCEVHFGMMSFNILYYTESCECRIAVQWDNKNIKYIWLRDQAVDNKVIKEAIEDFKSEFRVLAEAACA